MRVSDFLLIASGVLSMTVAASAATRYVDLNNPAPVAPYTSWATAATTIQAAVDAAVVGDEIVVTNGTYASGGRAVYGTMSNRVAIDKAVTVRSVNGPRVTIIEGGAAPGASNGNGSGAVRCVYVGINTVLSGFTLTNGHTLTTGDSDAEGSGGGAWCEVSGVVTNCTLRGNCADSYAGGAYSGTLNNCTLTGNSAYCGGGTYSGTLNNCALSGNSATYGGGVDDGTLTNCTLNGNSAWEGGGAASSTLNNCTLSGNSASESGGGAHYGTLNNCTLSGNSASYAGGGAYLSTLKNCTLSRNSGSSGGGASSATLNNCILSGNSALDGGGVYSGTLNNCTLSGNWAKSYGGGAAYGTLNNCIVYYNIARTGSNYYGFSSKFNQCCTVPLPPGPGNIDTEPMLASTSHLSEQSPCIGRGSSAYSSGLDIDGERWLDPPCIGADQLSRGQATGALALAIEATYTNVAPGFLAPFVALNEGRISASVWDFGDGTVVSNRAYASHAWAAPGLYTVHLTGYNDSWPGGVSTTVQVRVDSQSVYYVDAGNTTPVYPYTSWATAATDIQAAVDIAVAGDEIVVTNGTYASGGRAVYGAMTNRVAIDKAVTVRSVNGPLVTVIEGGAAPPGASDGSGNGSGAVRCVYVGTNAVLSGFTLTNGHTRTCGDSDAEECGGGAWCEVSGVITNCTLSGNSARYYGGGVYNGTLNNCTLIGNSAYCGGGTYAGTLNNCALNGNSANVAGGGTYAGTLNNCVLSGNSATYGGGVYDGTLTNCTLNGNSAENGGGAHSSTLNNCTLSGNSTWYGGGASRATLNNCTLTGNSAHYEGGGAFYGTLNNCTLIGNSATTGAGAYSGTLNNCIVYYNIAANGANYYGSSQFSYCCTVPLPPGPGNIDSEPLLASTSHLSEQSPCIGRGSSAYSSGLDIDGERWLDPPCIGADQFVRGQATGALALAIEATYTNVAAGFPVSFVALNEGRISASVWDFGDGTVISNRAYASHAWATPGLYTVRLTGYNDSWPGGVSTTLQVRVGGQSVYYVNAGNTTPTYPYTNWAGAAANIQDAIDAGTQIGRLVLVADGVYRTGGRAVYGIMTNRVVVTEGVEVRSVNGPLVTIIEGRAAPGASNGNGSGAVRCVYVGTNAVLSGFTLTNGHTQASGDIYKGRSGGGAWCEVSGVVNNCTLSGNSANSSGGGVYFGTLNNCTLSGNSASIDGGGARSSTLNNCTLSGNSANSYGGGAYSAMLNNCIVYYNSASDGQNYGNSTLNYCCATPLPPGPGNIDCEPLLASASHLSEQSPCIGRGSSAYSSGPDIDGERWLDPPCIGADQFVRGQATGVLSLAINATYTHVAAGFPVSFVALNEGRVSASVWDFGDATVVSNRPFASHAWATPGLYTVRLTGYNDSWSGGVSTTVQVQVVPREIHYVSAGNVTPVHPYTSWAGAAANIQDAIDAGTQPGRLVLVADGVYKTGGRALYGMLTNRVVVTDGVEVRSVNGPLVTIIEGRAVPGLMNGNGAIRCVYVGIKAVLSGFTLTNGHTRATADDYKEQSGGGAWCEVSGVITNCTLRANSAGYQGGGVYSGTLNNCILSGNSSGSYGGGAYVSTLNNCTLSGNSASYGGGASGGTLNNCIVYYNIAPTGSNYYGSSCKFSYCCTTPLPSGPGNIEGAPGFVDTNGWSNLRLQTNSPCINAGANRYVSTSTDLDGSPRIVGGTVDMGAYEFQSPASTISYAWLRQYGLSTDGLADLADSDADGLNNWQEWAAGTNPTNSASVLRMLAMPPASGTTNGITVGWTSVTNRTYCLERASVLGTAPGFGIVRSNISALNNTTTFTDTNAAGPGPFFYRVRVEN